MALKSLTTDQMIQLTDALIAPDGEPRAVLAAVDGGGALLAQLERSHSELVATLAPPTTALAKLITEMFELDTRHDRCVRALLHRIDSEIELAETDQARDALYELRHALFPAGAAVAQRSYVDEASDAVVRDARVNDAMRELLASMTSLGGRTCADVLDMLQAAARALGEAEERRVALGASGEIVIKASQARAHWAQIIGAVAAVLTAAGIDEAPVLGAVRAAESAAEGHGPLPEERTETGLQTQTLETGLFEDHDVPEEKTLA